jgi:hypothetical protein
LIFERTKAALRAEPRRAANLLPLVREIQRAGASSLNAMWQ